MVWTIVRYGQDKLLNRHNDIFVKTNAWKALLMKIKTLHWNWASFGAKWRFSVVFWLVWKWPQPVRWKYHAVKNITYVLLFSRLWYVRIKLLSGRGWKMKKLLAKPRSLWYVHFVLPILFVSDKAVLLRYQS